jgi:uncharacterized membrane protein
MWDLKRGLVAFSGRAEQNNVLAGRGGFAMWKLWLGVLLFAGPHLFSQFARGRRVSLIQRFGENGYKGIYSLVTLAGLVLLAMAYLAGRSGPASLDVLYNPPPGVRHLAILFVFIGFIFIFANGSKGYIRKAVIHPFSIGVSLWSIGHLLTNGERAVVVIFIMLLAISLLDITLGFARGERPNHAPDWKHDLRAVVVGVVLFLVFAYGFHPYVLNIPVLG